MPINPISLVLTLVGGLVLAGLLGWIRRPRLIVLVPRTFSYSNITDKGQVVEVSVFNRGFKTEENIDLTLNPALKYEMLGANSPDASVEKNKLKMSRIAPSDEITVLLIVEDGAFKSDDITQIVSKETKGIKVSRLDEVTPTAGQRVWLVGFFIVFPAVCYLGYLGLESAFGSATPKEEKNAAAVVSITPDLKGWNTESFYRRDDNRLFKEITSNKISVDIGALTGRGDVISVPFKIKNDGQKAIKITIEATTAASEKRIPSWEQRTSEIIIFPKSAQERVMKVILPAKPVTAADRAIFMEAFIKDQDGQSIKLTRQYIAPDKI